MKTIKRIAKELFGKKQDSPRVARAKSIIKTHEDMMAFLEVLITGTAPAATFPASEWRKHVTCSYCDESMEATPRADGLTGFYCYGCNNEFNA